MRLPLNRRLWLAAAVVLAAPALVGCRGGGPEGRVEDLFVGNKRYTIDEERGLVHVYGRLENTGQARFRVVEIHAVLRSAGGDKRGENTVMLRNLKPGEKRIFALTVTSHDRTRDVEIEVRLPEESAD